MYIWPCDLYTPKIKIRPSKDDPMIFISHCNANWERYEIEENDSSLQSQQKRQCSCDPNSPTVKSVPLILLPVCQSIETLFLIHDLHITFGAGRLFYSNIFMWSSKLCLVRTNRIFVHPALFFLSPLVPLNPNVTFLPLMTLPRAVGELQPGQGPRLFHEIFWLLRKSVHFLEPVWDRQCSAVRSRTGIQWPLIHRKCCETHSKSILPQLSTGWVSACLMWVPFPGSVRRKCFTNTMDNFAHLERECSCEWLFLKFPVSRVHSSQPKEGVP